jgi:glycosyltransferase involved in cell wall biosynthesis
MTNMTTALAADAVWFNSAFHRDSFLTALQTFLKRMPDYQGPETVERIERKACVHPPGVQSIPKRGERRPGPVRILWAARWEHDKNPETFFEALSRLARQGIEFRLSVVGEQFRETPEAFRQIRKHFADCIDRWGYQADRSDYEAALREADVFISTAEHEFFGISAVEAALAGAYPLLPRRLAYPEIFGFEPETVTEPFFYDGSAADLANKLSTLARQQGEATLPADLLENLRERLKRFEWPQLVPVLDEAIEGVAADSAS